MRNGSPYRYLSVSNAMKAALLLLSISSTALADDAALLACRGMADASARLACYDAIVVTTGEDKAPQIETTQREQFGFGRPPGTTAVEAIESHIPGPFRGRGPGTSIRV